MEIRKDGRRPDEQRPVTITPGFMRTADGSCLIATGNTRVICTASVEEGVPPFLKGKGQGWVTAEYAMLPASTGHRKQRDGIKKDGRSVEIQRLIGRSLRQAVDMTMLGERTVTIDCDVLEADGGTRTASITGAYVALVLAMAKLIRTGKLLVSPVIGQVAAISAGIIDDTPCLDLPYEEDSRAQVDMNLIMNDKGEFIEVQGTGEGRAFTPDELNSLLALGKKGTQELMRAQREALGDISSLIAPRATVVVATGNEHKLTEMRAIFGKAYNLISMKEAGFAGDIDENGDTFAANAAIKAETVARAVNLPVLADDSGLCVDALNGAPGVHSARFAGEHGNDDANNDLLLEKLQNETNRAAAFHCVMALAAPGKETLFSEGVCPGEITRERRGDNHFGYDPLFLYDGKMTFAQMDESDKNHVSHRSRAAEGMKPLLATLLNQKV